MGKTVIHAINSEGFHVEFHAEDDAEYTHLNAKLSDPDLGYKPTGGTATPTVQADPSVPASLACQFCGKAVTGTPKIGNNGPYTAEQVSTSRSNKMEKMGKKAGPVCGNCWNKAGHKQAWDAWYSANS